jgi:signal transduction histidine kinase/PAS domain-containing protein
MTLVYFANLLILLIVVTVVAVSLFIKVNKQKKYIAALKKAKELDSLINNAGLGGYYYWSKELLSTTISEKLIKILSIKEDINSFANLAKLFTDDEKKLIEIVNKLKRGRLSNFSMTINYFDGKIVKKIYCVGNRVDDFEGSIKGVVIWFYDISEYIEEINTLTLQYNILKKEAKDYLNIYNSVPFPVWWRDPALTIIRCNLAYGHIVNNGQADVGNLSKIPELDDNVKELLRDAIEQNVTIHKKKHIVIDGERRYFEISELPISNGEVLGYALDITELEDLEKDLQRHISAHSDLLESSSSAMAIYGSDTKLRFYNNAFSKLWELDEKWLNNNPKYSEILEQLREKRKLPEQADFKSFRNEQLKLFQDLIDPRDEFFYLPDGKTLRVIVIPHALGGLLFAYEDMTDRFAIERSYNTLIEVQKETLDNLSEAVVVFGQDGSLKLYNPVYAQMWPDEALALKSKSKSYELMDLSKGLYNYGSDWEAFKKEWMQLPATKTPIKKRVERTDGKILEKLVVPLPDGNFLHSYQDVTAIIEAERRLREKNEALQEVDNLKTEFLANVSYELRTPLTSITGFSEILRSEQFGILNEKQKEYIDGVIESSNDLMVLISDILDLTSIEAGYMSLDVKPFNIFDMLSGLVKSVEVRFKSSGKQLFLDCNKNIGVMIGDEKRLRQVILNLISNSFKYTENRGKISIVVFENKLSDIEFVVEDDGIGIPRSEIDKVFDSFFKSSGVGSKKKIGAGLGLSVVKNVVELHGGTVSIESKLGVGTKVICILKRNNEKLL